MVVHTTHEADTPTEPAPGSAAAPIGSGAPEVPGDASVMSDIDRSPQPQHLSSTTSAKTV